MENFIKKVSSYQLFNNLYPGVLLWFAICNLFSVQVKEGNLIVVVFVCYFLGMVASRIGSLVVEPVAKCIVKWHNKGDYVEATRRDSTILTLMQEANTYRTLSALGILVLLALVVRDSLIANLAYLAFRMMLGNFGAVLGIYSLLQSVSMASLGSVGVVVLFMLSYIKQLNHIQQRVEFALKSNSNA